MRSGVRLGIDVGKARIGVARSDLHGMLATPVETIARDHESDADVSRLMAIIRELEVFECVVGLPVNMQGQRTLSTEDAETFAEQVLLALHATNKASDSAVVIRLIDERLSTVSAHGQLRQAGKKSKQTKSIIDQAAAVVILQHALDSERAQSRAPGVELSLPSSSDSVNSSAAEESETDVSA